MAINYDLIVIGAGSGGLAAAKRAASYGAKVAVIESDKVGGTCVIRGCVPKKLLVYASYYQDHIKNALSYGISLKGSKIDSSVLLSNIREEVSRLNKIHIKNLKSAGVDLVYGFGSLIGENSILVTNKNSKELVISFEKCIISVGSEPIIPNIVGNKLCSSSDDIFELRKLPKSIVIIGGGYIACEFACILKRLGVEVDQVVRGEMLLRGFDKEISTHLSEEMKAQGIKIIFGQKVDEIFETNKVLNVRLSNNVEIKTEYVLAATGRKPKINGLNLDRRGIVLKEGRIQTNKYFQTSQEHIYAIGDVSNNINLTPVAIDEGRKLADRLFDSKDSLIDYSLVPSAVFSQPEIAFIGMNEEEAISVKGKDNIKIYRSRFRPMSKSLPKQSTYCLLKLIVCKKTNKILGCHMAGENAAEIIQMASISISMGAKKNDFDYTMALHPTIAEEFVTMT